MTSPLQQKIKISGPSVVTANRTGDGIVIYRTAHGWSEHLADAEIVRNADEARKLLSEATADDVGAVGAYIAPVEVEGSDIKPGNLREHIRADGVTSDILPSA